MALLITITDAGRAEIINADNTGTGPVVITEIGFGTGQYAPSKAQTALTNEVKRVSSIAGLAVAADTIHVMAKDEGTDAYNVGEFGLYSASGTLVAVYSQVAGAGWIIQKAGASTLLLAVDIILESLDAASLSFGDVTFINPPATTETPGVVQLENSLTSSSTSKALTAAQGKKLEDEKQAKHDNLTALAGLLGLADGLPYFTGAGALSLSTLTAKARTLLASADEATMRSVLQLIKQTNDVDTTAGALMLVGAGGWLGTTLPAFPGFATAHVGLYIITDITAIAGAPAGTTGAYVIFVRRNNHYTLWQNATGATARTFEGVATTAGVAPAVWRELWHSGNLVKQSFTTDTTAGAVMINGAFGIGGMVVKAETDLDTYQVAGKYITPASGVTSLPPGWVQGRHLVEVSGGAGNYVSQLLIGLSANVGKVAIRSFANPTWQPWVELWHSGNLVKQSASFDTTAGRVMLNGAHGLGGTSTVLPTNDFNELTDYTGFTRNDNAIVATNAPDGLSQNPFAIFNCRFNATYGWQMAGLSNGAAPADSAIRLFLRNEVAGSWSNWAELWHTKNLVKQASATDTTAGALMAVGAFGLGSNTVTAVTDLDSAVVSGVYSFGLSPVGSPGFSYGTLLVQGRTAAETTQLAIGITVDRMSVRRRTGGAWSPWVELWHSGNFTPAELSPPGEVSYFASNTAPPGWLKANGATLSRTTYAALFAAIGTAFGAGDGSTTFKVPDLRGEFPRGWDDGRGVDSGRVFGSWQAADLQSHTHTVGGSIDGSGGTGSFDGNPDAPSFNKTTSATGGTETRPRNIALLACIKY